MAANQQLTGATARLLRHLTETLTITNWKGSMTNYQNGEVNSGLSYAIPTAGNNPFLYPGTLSWSNESEQIDPNGSVITDLIMAGKERVENGVLYVYAIGHTGRLYKIQVNDPTTYNNDYDNPVLLTTLTINSPTFTRGGFIDFYGVTSEKIYIGHDMGLTSVNFDGTGEAFVGVLGSWVQNVPRPLQQFIGVLYIGNGPNIAKVDSTLTVVSYAWLNPGFPADTQVRDMDLTPDGVYLEAVVSRLALPNITSTAQDTTQTASSDSFIFKWNGTDTGYTAFSTFPSFSLTSNIMFQNYQYTFGYDQYGAAMFNPTEKKLSLQECISPLPNAVSSTGNIVLFITPLYFGTGMEVDIFAFGSLDFDVGLGYWDLLSQQATGTETDVIQAPMMMTVSNFGIGSSSNGYPGNVYGQSKIYFSTLETSATPTTKYKLYKWSPSASPLSTGNASTFTTYQTQTQLFSKKVKLAEIRIYAQPWVENNSFLIDIIGSDGLPILGASKTFTAGATAGDGVLVIGEDYAWYTPQCSPTYAIGVSIQNLGTANNIINKVEIDYTGGGK